MISFFKYINLWLWPWSWFAIDIIIVIKILISISDLSSLRYNMLYNIWNRQGNARFEIKRKYSKIKISAKLSSLSWQHDFCHPRFLWFPHPRKRKHDIMISAEPLFPHLKNPNSVTFATCAFSAFHISMQFSGGQGNAHPCNKIINHHHKNHHHHHKNRKTSPNCQRGRLPSRFRLPKLFGG